MEKQVCKSCKTEFTDKTYIDTCPICRGKNISRWDYITINGREQKVKLS